MSYAPKNVRDRIKETDRFTRADAIVTDEQRAAIATTWAARDCARQTYAPIPPGYPAQFTITPAKVTTARGTTMGLAAVKELRRARLKELFELEAAQYEKELKAMGLALNKPREF